MGGFVLVHLISVGRVKRCRSKWPSSFYCHREVIYLTQWMQDTVGVTWNKCTQVSTDHHLCWGRNYDSISHCIWISDLLARIFSLAQISYPFYLLCWIEISLNVTEGSNISCFSQPWHYWHFGLDTSLL